jgi:transglutaminase-like putative cysteine protease
LEWPFTLGLLRTDFTHLGITLARALGIPARAVSAYALELNPPDFHAIFEVYLENGWWLIDPTRLAPIEGIVRIGSGRDASDVAFLTSDKQWSSPPANHRGFEITIVLERQLIRLTRCNKSVPPEL